MRNNEIKNEIYEIEKWEEKIKRKDLRYETKRVYTWFLAIRFFGESSHTQKASIVEAEEDQNNPLKKYRRIW